MGEAHPPSVCLCPLAHPALRLRLPNRSLTASAPVAIVICAELDSVIAAEKEFDPQFCAYYLRECLGYHLGQAEREGLSMFRSLCEKHGILFPDPTLVL